MQSTHKLDFLCKPWKAPFWFSSKGWYEFRIGTCEGQWRATEDSYDILSIRNRQKHNGHFEDVLEWFEYSCIRDKKAFRILEVWNKRFKKHLIDKRGFTIFTKNHVQKIYLNSSFK